MGWPEAPRLDQYHRPIHVPVLAPFGVEGLRLAGMRMYSLKPEAGCPPWRPGLAVAAAPDRRGEGAVLVMRSYRGAGRTARGSLVLRFPLVSMPRMALPSGWPERPPRRRPREGAWPRGLRRRPRIVPQRPAARGGTVRSDVACERLRAIVRDPAFDWSGVTVVTHEDIPGENVVALIEDDQPLLAATEIRHCYEPVALVTRAPIHTPAARAQDHHARRRAPCPRLDDRGLARQAPGHLQGGRRQEALRHRARARWPTDAGLLAGCDVVVSNVPRPPPGAALHRAAGHDRVDGRRRRSRHRVSPVSVLRPQGPQAGVRRDGRAGPRDAGGDRRRHRGQGGSARASSLRPTPPFSRARPACRCAWSTGRKADIEATTKRHPAKVEITTGCTKDGAWSRSTCAR